MRLAAYSLEYWAYTQQNQGGEIARVGGNAAKTLDNCYRNPAAAGVIHDACSTATILTQKRCLSRGNASSVSAKFKVHIWSRRA